MIIDCLEFNRDFRILDAVSELAFLALECERLGAPQVGDLILRTCCEQTGDRPPGRLVTFYKSYHACLRAKIALWHLKDDGIRDWAKWTARAVDYLYLAANAKSKSFRACGQSHVQLRSFTRRSAISRVRRSARNKMPAGTYESQIPSRRSVPCLD